MVLITFPKFSGVHEPESSGDELLMRASCPQFCGTVRNIQSDLLTRGSSDRTGKVHVEDARMVMKRKQPHDTDRQTRSRG
jgi:hypothetical protein